MCTAALGTRPSAIYGEQTCSRRTTRIVAFIGTLGASATLIGMAATNTGAYFTDTETGTIDRQPAATSSVDKGSDYDAELRDLDAG